MLFSHFYGNIAKSYICMLFETHLNTNLRKISKFHRSFFKQKNKSIRKTVKVSDATRVIANDDGAPPKAKSRILREVNYTEFSRI